MDSRARRARRDRGGYPRVELGGRRYVILPETAFERLEAAARGAAGDWLAADGPSPFTEPVEGLGERLAARRREAGLTQATLAQAAGIRVETLNRIERGHTTPDYATIRKLVTAMNARSHAT